MHGSGARFLVFCISWYLNFGSLLHATSFLKKNSVSRDHVHLGAWGFLGRKYFIKDWGARPAAFLVLVLPLSRPSAFPSELWDFLPHSQSSCPVLQGKFLRIRSQGAVFPSLPVFPLPPVSECWPLDLLLIYLLSPVSISVFFFTGLSGRFL